MASLQLRFIFLITAGENHIKTDRWRPELQLGRVATNGFLILEAKLFDQP